MKNESIILISVDLRYHEDPNEETMNLGEYSLQNNETLFDKLKEIFCEGFCYNI